MVKSLCILLSRFVPKKVARISTKVGEYGFKTTIKAEAFRKKYLIINANKYQHVQILLPCHYYYLVQ